MMKRMLMSLFVIAAAVVALLILLPSQVDFSHDDVAQEPHLAAQKLIFLLQYIGVDYPEAVQNGRVVNDFEYGEMQEFADQVLEGYRSLRGETATPGVVAQLQDLATQIRQKAPADHIKRLSTALADRLIAEFAINSYPEQSPDLANGAELYRVGCAECHGPRGAGDGRTSAELDPRPTNFTEPAYLNEATPLRFFNAMTFGIEGTVMPSYRQAFTPQQRWDVAFYLMTLREDFAPQQPDRDYEISLKDLATRSNAQLLERLESGNGNTSPTLLRILDYLRGHPQKVEE